MRIKSGQVPPIVTSEALTGCTLVKVLVGKSADEHFHIVDYDHSVHEVCGQFGTYVKFIVTVAVDCENIPPPINAFAIMMESQKQVYQNLSKLVIMPHSNM